MNLQEYFRTEDLNDDLALVASVCGNAAAFGLAEHFAGMNLYIPGRPFAKAKERAIFERYQRGERELKEKKRPLLSKQIYSLIRVCFSMKRKRAICALLLTSQGRAS